MASSAAHTLKAFDDDLEDLRALVAALGGWAEAAVREAMEALLRRDGALADLALDRTDSVTRLAASVERRSLCIIALRAPVGSDLREVLGALKIAGLIARISDHAASVATAIPCIDPALAIGCPRALGTLARTSAEALRAALNAFVARDPEAAAVLAEARIATERLYATLLSSCLEAMRRDPGAITSAINLLFVARSLARIADHAAELASAVHFTMTGEEQELAATTASSADLMEHH